MSKLKAFRCQAPGFGPILLAAVSASKARATAHREARDCGHTLAYIELQVKRAPEADIPVVEAAEDARRYWRDTHKFARLQAQADAFNAAYPVGTSVLVVNCDEATTVFTSQPTRTRSPAWVPNLEDVLVSVEGQAGGFGLAYIQPLSIRAAHPHP